MLHKEPEPNKCVLRDPRSACEQPFCSDVETHRAPRGQSCLRVIAAGVGFKKCNQHTVMRKCLASRLCPPVEHHKHFDTHRRRSGGDCRVAELEPCRGGAGKIFPLLSVEVPLPCQGLLHMLSAACKLT